MCYHVPCCLIARIGLSMKESSYGDRSATHIPARIPGRPGAATAGGDAGDGGLREGDPLPDHRPFVRLLLLRGRADDRRAAGVRAWLRLRLLDGLVRAGGAGEWWRRGASRGLG